MADSNNGTKKCPQCQEEIAASAKKSQYQELLY